MSIGIIALSSQGWRIAHRLSEAIPDAQVYLHENVSTDSREMPVRFKRITDLTREIFSQHKGLVYITPCGVVVRATAPLVADKYTDPAVVVMDVGARHVISLLSGHEGGANRLAIEVANIIGAEPVITTTTEATKNLIVGIGCRKQTTKAALVHTVHKTLRDQSLALDNVRLLATADIKRDEQGLFEAAFELGVPLILIASDRIRAFKGAFEPSEFVEQSIGLPAVAEPCALLAGTRTQLIMGKKKCNGITIAIARENCSWSE